jgi:hypothetical protein
MNTTGRDYKRERATESDHRRQARSNRNKARRIMLAHLTKKHGAEQARRMMAGKDVDHITPDAQGGATTIGNLRLRDPHANRSDKGTIFKGKKTTRPKDPIHHWGIVRIAKIIFPHSAIWIK